MSARIKSTRNVKNAKRQDRGVLRASRVFGLVGLALFIIGFAAVGIYLKNHSNAAEPGNGHSAPTVTAKVDSPTSVLVSWTNTASDKNMRTITITGGPQPISVDPSSTSVEVTGLTPGQGYVLTVTETWNSQQSATGISNSIVIPLPVVSKLTATFGGSFGVSYLGGTSNVFSIHINNVSNVAVHGWTLSLTVPSGVTLIPPTNQPNTYSGGWKLVSTTGNTYVIASNFSTGYTLPVGSYTNIFVVATGSKSVVPTNMTATYTN